MSFASLFVPYFLVDCHRGGNHWWEVRKEVRTTIDTYSKEIARFDDEDEARAVLHLLNTQWRVEMGYHIN